MDATVSPQTAPVLVMRNITKNYPGVKALKGVNFDLLPGEVHALVGENGAGKSTLMKVLAGAEQRDGGELIVNGVSVDGVTPARAQELGIAIIYQEFNLVPYLSIAENIFLGREPKAALPGFVNYKELNRAAEALLRRLKVDLDPRREVATLAVADQQMVEIAKALSQEARILVMDEPSAALTEHELEALFELIHTLRDEGRSIVYISHRLEEVFVISDRVTVMRDGDEVSTKLTSDVTRDSLIRDMVGRDMTETFPTHTPTIGDPLLEVRHMSRKGTLEDVSIMVRKGEIVGLAGLVGAGRTELARCIFGADRYDEGEILLDGQAIRVRSPKDAIEQGIGLVTEDRKQQGLVLGMAVRENTTLANLGSLTQLGFVQAAKERAISNKYITDLAIKTPSGEQTVRNLSGGNQQKVVLAKWLFTESKVLIFDEPTRGIDVGAKYEIYLLMHKLAEQGNGILMISSELPEVLGMSDRIVVMHEGHIAGELPRANATSEAVMHLATGGQ
ncbi:MAG TPA: sugar ABC transporter ATP-binding protein [Armatimonadota bacterium]|jgi:ribose transport system ATP-binding protein